jgi:hypothetical protein
LRRASVLLGLLLAVLQVSASVAAENQLPGSTSCDLKLPTTNSLGESWELATGPWTEAEQYVWSRICLGGVADLKALDPSGEDIACHPDEHEGPLPATRLVRGELFTLVATIEPWAALAERNEIAVRCAVVVGGLQLHRSPVANPLRLEGSVVAGDLRLNGARFAGSLRLENVAVYGGILAEGASFEHQFVLRSVVAEAVNLDHALVEGPISLDRLNTEALSAIGVRAADVAIADSKISEALFYFAEVSGNFSAERFQFAETLGLAGARLNGGLSLDAVWGGDINLNEASILAGLHADDVEVDELGMFGLVVERMVVIDALDVRGSLGMDRLICPTLRISDLSVGDRFSAQGSRVSGLVIVSDFHADTLDLLDASIDGAAFFVDGAAATLVIARARFGAGLALRGLQVSDRMMAIGVDIEGDLEISSASSLAEVDMSDADIAGSVKLSGARFDGLLNATRAEVDGEIVLSDSGLPGPVWSSQARIKLLGASAKVVQGVTEDWTDESGQLVERDLRGFQYDGLRGVVSDEGVPLDRASSGWLLDWARVGGAETRDFDPQPFETLAAALRTAGAEDRAVEVEFARQDALFASSIAGSAPLGLLRSLSKFLVGHGVYPFRVLWWFGALILVGWILLMTVDSGGLRRPDRVLWFSVENALPLMELVELNKSVEFANPWVEGYFRAQKVLGFALASILVGALGIVVA